MQAIYRALKIKTKMNISHCLKSFGLELLSFRFSSQGSQNQAAFLIPRPAREKKKTRNECRILLAYQ